MDRMLVMMLFWHAFKHVIQDCTFTRTLTKLSFSARSLLKPFSNVSSKATTSEIMDLA